MNILIRYFTIQCIAAISINVGKKGADTRITRHAATRILCVNRPVFSLPSVSNLYHSYYYVSLIRCLLVFKCIIFLLHLDKSGSRIFIACAMKFAYFRGPPRSMNTDEIPLVLSIFHITIPKYPYTVLQT